MKLTKEFIFPEISGEVHASTLLELDNDCFLSAWFEGTKEGRDDVRIRWAMRMQNGRWTEPGTVPSVDDLPHWNPVLFRLPSGEIALYFKLGRKIETWKTYESKYIPGQAEWTNPHELVEGDESGGRGPVKNKPVLLADGRIAAPASRENSEWCSFVDFSSDGGRSWQKSVEPVSSVDVIQPTIWESAPGILHMLLRSNCGSICRSDSYDGGLSWSAVYKTELPNNNSGIDLARLNDGTLVLAGNPESKNWGPRNRLNLYISHDNGEAWASQELDSSDCLEFEDGRKAEFSYPAVISLVNGGFACTYTKHRRTIAFVICKMPEHVRFEPTEGFLVF